MNAGTRTLVALAAVLVLVAGCGDDATPAAQVPALSGRLDAVDAAVAAHDDAAARKAINALEQTTTAARRSGELDPARAGEIVRAAEAMLAALGEDEPAETPAESPSPSTGDSEPEGTPHPPPEKPEKPEKKDEGKKDEHGKHEKPEKEHHGH